MAGTGWHQCSVSTPHAGWSLQASRENCSIPARSVLPASAGGLGRQHLLFSSTERSFQRSWIQILPLRV